MCHDVLEHSPKVYSIRKTYKKHASAVSGEWRRDKILPHAGHMLKPHV